MPSKHYLLERFTLVLALSFGAMQAHGQAASHDHGTAHAHSEQEAAALTLNDGQKWETDAALRHGMTEIKAAVQMLAPAFESGALNAAQAESLTQVIHNSVNTMIEQCKLAPEADANLHTILATILAAGAALEASPSSPNGVPALQHALETYGQYFNHEGWLSDEHAGHSH